MDIIELALTAVDCPGISGHLALRHQHIRILVLTHILHGYVIDGVGLGRARGIDDIELCHMPLTYDGYRTSEFVVIHPACWLDADNVVSTLVADNLCRGNIYQLDVLRHDDVRGDFLIDENGVLTHVAFKDIGILWLGITDIPDRCRVWFDVLVFLLGDGLRYECRHDSKRN